MGLVFGSIGRSRGVSQRANTKTSLALWVFNPPWAKDVR